MSDAKVILVTGASSGFGALTVRALADEHGVTLRPVEMDVSDQASIDKAVATGRIDVHRVVRQPVPY